MSRWASLERPARILVWLLIALVVVELYHQTEFLVQNVVGVLLLFVFGAIIALLLTPVIDRMEQLPPFRERRALAVLALAVVLIGLVVGAGVVFAPSLMAQARQLPELQSRGLAVIAAIQDQLNRWGVPFRLSLPAGAGSLTTGVITSVLGILTGTLTTVINALLVTVISIYLLVQGRSLIAALRNLFPAHHELFDFTLVAVGSTVAAYARGQLLMSVVMATYVGTVMTIIGVRYAIFLALATFVLEFLPLIGAPIAMGLAVIIALFQSPLLAVLAALAGLGGHALEAYVLGPRVQGHVTRLHPLAAMAALLVGAELAGVLGALFAVPLAAIANVFLGALYRTRRGADVLPTVEGRPPHADELPTLGEEIGQVDPGASSSTPPGEHKRRKAG